MLARFLIAGLAGAFLAGAAATACAASKIGVAAAVRNDVQALQGRAARALSVGSDLFASERIRTGATGSAQLLLLDKTSLTVGPNAELGLEQFAYNADRGTGRVVIDAVQGAMRFISGSQNPRDYTIRTPIVTLGLRGTVVDLIVSNGQVIVILVEGALTMTVNGRTYTLDRPGTAFIFSADGTVQGPVTWDGAILNAAGDIPIPLYGWHFQGEQPPTGLQDYTVGNIDQLNAIIQGSLQPSPTPKPRSTR
jgi:hypothetical protein